MRHRAVVWSSGVAALLGVLLLLGPPLGTDLSAQVAHADFFRGYGLTPLDLRWYGGTQQFGYSLVSPPVMAVLGPRLTGVLAMLASTVGFALLVVRLGAKRPVLGAVLAAVAFAGNLVSGRVTFALGVAFGVWALFGLTVERRRLRYPIVAVGGFLASAASPVAGLFVGLAAAALILAQPRRGYPAAVLAVAAGVPILLDAVLFSDGGMMNLGRNDTIRAAVTGLAVALLVPKRSVRIGGVLAAVGVLAAFAVATPVGLNATRLATMFALPVLAAFATLERRRLALVLVVLACWQPPLMLTDVRDAGNPTASRAYFTPLLDELARRDPGRVEVPPTRDSWEAAFVAPLARGWLRQVDLDRNRLFFGSSLTADEYGSWLRDNGVAYVALPDAELSWVARSEQRVIATRPAYLREVWHGPHWTLFQVAGNPSIVDGAVLVAATPSAVTFDVASAGDVEIRVRWSRWLVVHGPAPARLAQSARWTRVHLTAPGRYTLTS